MQATWVQSSWEMITSATAHDARMEKTAACTLCLVARLFIAWKCMQCSLAFALSTEHTHPPTHALPQHLADKPARSRGRMRWEIARGRRTGETSLARLHGVGSTAEERMEEGATNTFFQQSTLTILPKRPMATFLPRCPSLVQSLRCSSQRE
jgi:hypothetical protein